MTKDQYQKQRAEKRAAATQKQSLRALTKLLAERTFVRNAVKRGNHESA